MINHEIPHQSFAETETQITQYFNITDQAPLMSDTNKRYTHVQNSCYSPSCPITNSSTTLIISPTADNIADIYNGYIYAEMDISFAISGTAASAYSNTWIGYKDSMDAIEKYEILANGITIYTQNNATEESFIMNCASTDDIKKSDCFSKCRHKDVWKNKYGNKCGVWIDWSDQPEFPVKIKFKIDLRHFLPLSNVKYLPAFAGKIELKVWFTARTMVVSNCDPTLDTTIAIASNLTYPPITNEFVQIGDEFTIPISDATASGATTVTVAKRAIMISDIPTISLCESCINCFGLHQPIYDSLVERYSTQALTYPTQILQVNTMSGKVNNATSKATITITPRFIDSIFLLFPLKVTHKTVYKNPGFSSFQLNCGGYGQIPSTAFGTVDEPRLVEMCSNAVNLNNDTSGMNIEVINSLAHATKADQSLGFRSLDCTSFFIGMPTETDNTFQQGQTSATPISYELTITQDANSTYAKSVQSPPVICLLIDATFNIMVNTNGAPPMVSIGAADITTPERVE
jgi:hypothetical protein